MSGRVRVPYQMCAGSPFAILSAPDTTGRNSGNLTTAFTTGILGTMPPIWEWFRCMIGTQEPGQTFTPAPCTICRNGLTPITFTFPAGGTEWDPSQAIPLRSGDELYFYWALASSATPVPYVTLFARYDPTLPANQNFRG